MAFVWKKLKQEKTKRIRCIKCNNPLLQVIWEPVARQVHKRNAHHFRVIVKCPICKNIKRIKLGSPDK